MGSILGVIIGYLKASAIFGGIAAWMLGTGPAAKLFVTVLTFAGIGLAFGVYGITVMVDSFHSGTVAMKQQAGVSSGPTAGTDGEVEAKR